MELDRWHWYGQMLRSRLFEEAVAGLWREGAIPGEMHLGIGEEAVVAGVLAHLGDGDALALDHRGTPPLLMRGVDPVALLRELLGRPDGLCRGMGGHMHLFSKELLAASSGIVGAAGPGAAGFALAGLHLRPETVAIAFFGDGAINQGMLMESMNLAVAWNLPVLFVCKDNGWAITTRSESVTGGTPEERARGFGLATQVTDGTDLAAVWEAAGELIERARSGGGPGFLQARCSHPEGHFLGDPLLRIARHPVSEITEMTGPLLKSLGRRGGASLAKRAGGLGKIVGVVLRTVREQVRSERDPLAVARKPLAKEPDGRERLEELEESIVLEVGDIARTATEPVAAEAGR